MKTVLDIRDTINQRIDAEITRITEALARGNAADFPEYKRLAGSVRGLESARGIVLEVCNKEFDNED